MAALDPFQICYFMTLLFYPTTLSAIKFFHYISPQQPVYLCNLNIMLCYSKASTLLLCSYIIFTHFCLSLFVFLFSFSSCVGRSSVSCAWLRTDRQTRCLSARNSSRKTAGKSARLPRTKSWSWNCTQSVCGQMDAWLKGWRESGEGEIERMFSYLTFPIIFPIHVITLVKNVSSGVCNFCFTLFLKYLPRDLHPLLYI